MIKQTYGELLENKYHNCTGSMDQGDMLNGICLIYSGFIFQYQYS